MNSKRIRQVLHLVDELELDGEELSELRAQLDTRKAAEINADACKTEADRELAKLLAKRVDDIESGRVKPIPASDIIKQMRDAVRTVQREHARTPAPRRRRAAT